MTDVTHVPAEESTSLEDPIPWTAFYDDEEPIQIPAWMDADRVDQYVRDVRWENAHLRAIEVGLLTALAAAEGRWAGYGPHDYVPEILRRLTAEMYPRPEPKPSKRAKAKISGALRVEVMERDAYRCAHCGSHIDLVIDHVHPVARGGTNDIDNLQTLCDSCNKEKGTKTIEELGW